MLRFVILVDFIDAHLLELSVLVSLTFSSSLLICSANDDVEPGGSGKAKSNYISEGMRTVGGESGRCSACRR